MVKNHASSLAKNGGQITIDLRGIGWRRSDGCDFLTRWKSQNVRSQKAAPQVSGRRTACPCATHGLSLRGVTSPGA